MKSIKGLISVSILLLLTTHNIRSQTHLPDIVTRGIDGKEYNLSDFNDGDRPTAIIFWATWCKPCMDELDNISDYYSEWIDQEKFNFVTVCIDDSRTSATIRSFVNGKQWEFPVLFDGNQEIKRAMNVTDIPHYFLFNSAGKVVKRHTGYLPGDEDILFEEIKKLNNEK